MQGKIRPLNRNQIGWHLDLRFFSLQNNKKINICCLSYQYVVYAEYTMRNAGLDKAQAGIKIAKRYINNLRYADDTTLRAESEEELKRLLMKVKEESKKVG